MHVPYAIMTLFVKLHDFSQAKEIFSIFNFFLIILNFFKTFRIVNQIRLIHATNYFKNNINYKPKVVVKEGSFKITCDLANFSLSRAIIYLRKRFKARTCGPGKSEFIIPLKILTSLSLPFSGRKTNLCKEAIKVLYR